MPKTTSEHPNINRYLCFGASHGEPSNGGHAFVGSATSLADAIDIVGSGSEAGKYAWANVLDLVTGKLYNGLTCCIRQLKVTHGE